MPKVSVIIPAYNCQSFIAETVESILAQTYPDYEIIVVDDGSTDNTRDVLQRYEDRVRYVYQENSGVGAARNRGLSLARGEYIAFLDHDDLWLPEKLETQMKILETRPEVGLVYSNCYHIDEAGTILGRYFDHIKPARGMVFHQLFMTNFIPLLTVLVRKAVLDQVGTFRIGWSISEDYDLLLRVARKFILDYVETPLAKYRLHSGNVSRDVDRFLRENLLLAEELIQECPELAKMKARKLYRLYYDAAYQYLAQKETEKARQHFLNAVRSSPYALKALTFYLLTFLGLDAIEKLRSLKKAVST
jgi:glycosyltransferase involved in cell wall biosynthesis